MTTVTQESRLLRSTAAATEAERRLQDWAASHAGKNREKAKKTISIEGKGIPPEYSQEDLTITTTRAHEKMYTRRCTGYSIHYLPKRHGRKPQAYVAYAVIIFPHGESGPGAASITVHKPGSDWEDVTPPWLDVWEDPTNPLEEIFQAITQQDIRQRRKGRRENSNFPYQDLSEARQSSSPMVLITPKGNRDQDFAKLPQLYRDSVSMYLLSETAQLAMSAEIPDGSLRQWLNAKAAIVKDCMQPVPNDHPLHMFEERDAIKEVLDRIDREYSTNLHDMAHRAIIETLLDTINDCSSIQNLLDEAGRRDPLSIHEATLRILEDAQEDSPQDTETDDRAALQAQQRISTLEDQLQQEKDRSAGLEEHAARLQTQVDGYQQFMQLESQPNEHPNSETPKTRDDAVMEAITTPGKFPHLRFLNTATKTLPAYGKPKPGGEEIISALENINDLAALYLRSHNGSVGPWKDHLNLPGWAYANDESETTMGKHLRSRTFRDQDKDRQIVVGRHLTYRGAKSGLQIFFDTDGEAEPFIIAYIGEHLPYASERT